MRGNNDKIDKRHREQWRNVSFIHSYTGLLVHVHSNIYTLCVFLALGYSPLCVFLALGYIPLCVAAAQAEQ